MKKRIAKFFDYLMQKIKSPNFRTFLVFLLISFLIWTIEKMRQNYTVEINYRIAVTDVPDEYVVETDSLDPIRAIVSGDGLDLLRMPNKKHRVINVNINQIRKTIIDGCKTAILMPRRYTHDLSQTLPDHITLERIEADTIYIPLLTKAKKLLPVVVCDNVTLEPQHMYSAPRIVEPDSVWVSGTNNIVDTMQAVYTKKTSPIVLHDTISLSLNFDIPHSVEVSAPCVQVTYPVETYTEKNINVPITAINLPHGYNFKAFPPMVRVTTSVGLSKFDKLTPNDIDIVADLQEITPGSKQQKIKLRLANYPDYVRNISYSPIFVEFLLEKQHESITK